MTSYSGYLLLLAALIFMGFFPLSAALTEPDQLNPSQKIDPYTQQLDTTSRNFNSNTRKPVYYPQDNFRKLGSK